MNTLLTPTEALAHFRRRDPRWLRRAVQRGLLEAVNVGGRGHGARYLYRLRPLAPEPVLPSEEERQWLEVKRRHGL